MSTRVLRVSVLSFAFVAFGAGCAPTELDQSVESALGPGEHDDDFDDDGNFRGHARLRHAQSTGLPWASFGPSPPAVEATIQVDRASHTVYIASFGGGIIKSTDDGQHFADISNGINSLAVSSLAMAPTDSNTLYAGTANGGIYKTVDGGATWSITGETTGLPISLIVDPTNPDIVYAGYYGDNPVKKTTDGGATWFDSFEGMADYMAVWSIVVDPVNPSVAYAGTSGNGAFKTTDAGATWSPLTVDPTVWVVYIDPVDHNTVYGGTNGNGVFRSTDAGATFAPLGPLPVGVILSLAKSGSTLYAGTCSGGVWTSTDGGSSWSATRLNSGIGLTLTADDGGTVYVGTNFDGVRKTVNGGAEWTRVGWDSLKDCACQNGYGITADPSTPGRILFSTNDGGLLDHRGTPGHRRNGRGYDDYMTGQDDNHHGADDLWIDGGRAGFVNRAPKQVAFDPQDPNIVYSGSFFGGGFFRSEDGGTSWQRNLFLPTEHITGVSVDPVDRSVYVVLMGGPFGIYKSTDFGLTFTRIDRQVAGGDFFNANGRGIAVDPHNHNVVYYGGKNGVWRSADAGATWSRKATGLITTVTVDPTTSSIVYAGGQSVGVLKSTDGGLTFSPMNNGLGSLRISRTGGVQVDYTNHDTIYVGTEGDGVYKSNDGGLNWRHASSGLDNPLVLGTRIDPFDPSTLYVATSSSVYRTRSGAE